MPTYAIGDVQGHYEPLQRLLTHINYDSASDKLWFVGDLINRGPQSLAVIRFVKSLGGNAITVLGNHDLHFLAVASEVEVLGDKDTFQDVLAAPEVKEIVSWLRQQPLLYYDSDLECALVHAGIAPAWNLTQALGYAKEVEQALKSNRYKVYLANMYGNMPCQWKPSLKGWDRLRIITNYFTRMRYVDIDGRLELNYKGPIGGQPIGYYPWFDVPPRSSKAVKILFGHWASLQGSTGLSDVQALDTGCCWGNCLTAYCIETESVYAVSCKKDKFLSSKK